MGRTVTVTLALPKTIKDCLQFRSTRKDHADINCTQVEQKSKVVQVPIKKRIFIVPLQFKSHATFEAVHGMRWTHIFISVHLYKRGELPFQPTMCLERPVNTL